MLTIHTTQLAELGNDRLVTFFGRAQSFITAQLGMPVTAGEIETLYARGKSYGLRSEQDLVRYMFVAVAVGAVAQESDPDWMHRLLEVETPVNDLKLRRLFDEARHRLLPSIAQRIMQ